MTKKSKDYPFPVRGHKTLAEIDNILMQFGIEAYRGTPGYASERYRWARGLILKLLLDEVNTARGKT